MQVAIRCQATVFVSQAGMVYSVKRNATAGSMVPDAGNDVSVHTGANVIRLPVPVTARKDGLEGHVNKVGTYDFNGNLFYRYYDTYVIT